MSDSASYIQNFTEIRQIVMDGVIVLYYSCPSVSSFLFFIWIVLSEINDLIL